MQPEKASIWELGDWEFVAPAFGEPEDEAGAVVVPSCAT
jgi:hypothetical protein